MGVEAAAEYSLTPMSLEGVGEGTLSPLDGGFVGTAA